MSLFQPTQSTTTPAERFASEARARITEINQAMFLTYANIQNYLTNNGEGATREQIVAAFGKDRKDFEYILRAMKRFLIKVNPDMRAQLNALPEKPVKPAS